MMFKNVLFSGMLFVAPVALNAHCQMPCGIYHDNMVYDQIDQFVETVYKGITVLNDSKFSNSRERNECIRWVAEKESSCNNVAELILTYFLQQKIKPGEADTVKRLTTAHNLLFLLVAIKQNTDIDTVKQFNGEWEKFKLMFHRVGYECEMEKKTFLQLKELRDAQGAKAKAEHDEEHVDFTSEKAKPAGTSAK
jgi:nickel superoxide dismutase